MPEIAGLFAYRTISRKIDLGPRWSIAGYARWLLEPYGRPSRLEADTEVLDAYRFTDAALAAGRKMGWRGKFSSMPQLFATSGQLGLIWREGNVSYVVSQTELPRLDAAPSIHDFASILVDKGTTAPTKAGGKLQEIWAVSAEYRERSGGVA